MYLRKACLFILLTICINLLTAQDRIAEGVTPNLYVSHSVAAKETWYSIGRAYNISPKDLAGLNKLSIDRPLEVSQKIKVPLTSGNFVQTDMKNAASGFQPVYHIVQEKEWLYRISLNHNKVPVENLEKWNGITSDQVKPGMKLIVGYLKANGLVVSKPVTTANAPTPVVSQTNPGVTPAATNRVATGGPGYFKSQYGGNGKTTAGLAGVFKSTSGWNDGKYYALMNNVSVGTILKIDLLEGRKTIYAKVLGELPDMKESAGLALRISDAAASELGAPNGRFNVQVSY